jgi:WD40 repeat protein
MAGCPPPIYDVTVGIGYNNVPAILPSSVTLSGLRQQVTHAVISPDGWKVVGFDTSNTGIVWAVRSKRALFTLDNASSAVWSPDGAMLAVFSPDYSVRIVDARTGDVIAFFDGYEGMQLFWSPDSRKFALLAAGVLFIYEAT